jgi:tRNA threonylcarbamoyladenosine biosynthesis protein TsaB
MILALKSDQPIAELYLMKEQKELDAIKWEAHRQLSDTLIEKTEELLSKHGLETKDLTGLVVFQGPGSFTGLRIGITFFNTLSYTLSIPIVGSVGDDWLNIGTEALNNDQEIKVIMPEYGREARITKPRK